MELNNTEVADPESPGSISLESLSGQLLLVLESLKLVLLAKLCKNARKCL